MISREQVETLLRIHGVPPTAPDEQIRSILMSAEYHDEEVEGALLVLREAKNSPDAKLNGLYKIYRTDKSLEPNEISSLLGIDVNIDALPIKKMRQTTFTLRENVLIIILALLLAFIAVFYTMYEQQIGPFHISLL